MNRGALLGVGLGVWLLAQVFAGNMLGRLGLVGAPADQREAAAQEANDASAAARAGGGTA